MALQKSPKIPLNEKSTQIEDAKMNVSKKEGVRGGEGEGGGGRGDNFCL